MRALKLAPNRVVPYSISDVESYSFEHLKRIANKAYLNKAHLRDYVPTTKAEPLSEALKASALSEKLASKICPGHWLQGSDAAGHRYAKELVCRAEWCPICGKKNSIAHKRRFASWFPKAQQVSHLGLFVIEFPLSSRDKPRSRKALEYYGLLATKVLTGEWEIKGRRLRGEVLRRGEVAEVKARWFARGLRRWHYFGDIKNEYKQLHIKWQTEPSDESVPSSKVKSNCHLNVLVEAGWLMPGKLSHIQATLRVAFDEPKLIVNYGYVSKPGQIVHLLKYTTRATFLDYKWDTYLVGQLYGFRNMRSWGKWAKVDKQGKLPAEVALWSLKDLGEAKTEVAGLNIEAINSLSESRCPIDGLKIHWSKPMSIKSLRQTRGKRSLGAGYWRLPKVKEPLSHVVEPPAMYWRRLLVEFQQQERDKAELNALTREGEYYEALETEYFEALRLELERAKLYDGSQGKL
jgi:hypothetical protein